MANGAYTFRVPCPACGVYMLWMDPYGRCGTCGAHIVPSDDANNLSTALRGGEKSAWGRAQIISRLHEGRALWPESRLAVIRTCTGALMKAGKLGYVSRSFMDQMESWLEAQNDVSTWETATAREFERRWLLPGLKEARKVILELQDQGEPAESFSVQPIGALSDFEKASQVAKQASDDLAMQLAEETFANMVGPAKASTNGVNDPLKHFPMLVMPTPMVTKIISTPKAAKSWARAPSKPKEPTIEEKIDQAPKRARLELD